MRLGGWASSLERGRMCRYHQTSVASTSARSFLGKATFPASNGRSPNSDFSREPNPGSDGSSRASRAGDAAARSERTPVANDAKEMS